MRGYRLLGLPAHVDVGEVAHRELRWWVVRREIGLAAGNAAGEAITRLYTGVSATSMVYRPGWTGRLDGSGTAARPQCLTRQTAGAGFDPVDRLRPRTV